LKGYIYKSVNKKNLGFLDTPPPIPTCVSYIQLGVDIDANLNLLTFLSERQFLSSGFLPLMSDRLFVYYYKYDARVIRYGPYSRGQIKNDTQNLSQSYSSGSLPLSRSVQISYWFRLNCTLTVQSPFNRLITF
jgi:hypothetical protein